MLLENNLFSKQSSKTCLGTIDNQRCFNVFLFSKIKNCSWQQCPNIAITLVFPRNIFWTYCGLEGKGYYFMRVNLFKFAPSFTMKYLSRI